MKVFYIEVAVLVVSIFGWIILVGSTVGNHWVQVIDDRNQNLEAATYGLWKVCIWQLHKRHTMSCELWNDDSFPNVLNFKRDNIAWLDIPSALAVLSCIAGFLAMTLIVTSLIRRVKKRNILDIATVLSFITSAVFMIGATSYFTVNYEGMFPMYHEKLSWAYMGAWIGSAIILFCTIIEIMVVLRNYKTDLQTV